MNDTEMKLADLQEAYNSLKARYDTALEVLDLSLGFVNKVETLDIRYARYAEGRNNDVYVVLAREGNRVKVNGHWYPAVTYRKLSTGETFTRIAEDFDDKFRTFTTLQDATVWGVDF